MITTLIIIYAVFRIVYACVTGDTTAQPDYRGRDEPGDF